MMSSPPVKRYKPSVPGNKAGNELNQIFSGCVGLFLDQGIGKARCNILQKQFQSYGGVCEKSVTDKTTHIFVKRDLKWEKILRFSKVKSVDRSVKVIDVEWLSKCLVDGRKVDFDMYLVQQASEQSSKGDDEKEAICVSNHSSHNEAATQRADQFSNSVTRKTGVNQELLDLKNEMKDALSDEDDIEPATPSQLSKKTSVSINKKIGFWACANPSTSEAVNVNEHITDKLEILEKTYETTQDQWRARAYKKAIKAIKNHPTKLTSYEEVAALPFVGERLAKKIKEILETGHLRRLDHIDPKVKLLETFSKVWGAGPKTAEQWVAQGYKNLEDLSNHPNLTYQQKIGLKYYDDINERMPRNEVAEIEQHIRGIAEKLLPEVLLVVCGSYRRGRATCGDIDVLVSHKDNKSHIGFLLKLLDQLKAEELITNDLITVSKEEQRKYMGLIKLPGENRKQRRIDFIVAPYEEWACALMHFTGSAHFNRSIRLLAKKKSMSLSEHALRENVVRSSVKGEEKLNKGEIVTTRTEKDIFDHFGLDYLEPNERDW